MTNEQKIEVLKKALYLVGQYMRDYPPSELPDNRELMGIILGGNLRDPEGREYAAYFLTQAMHQPNTEA